MTDENPKFNAQNPKSALTDPNSLPGTKKSSSKDENASSTAENSQSEEVDSQLPPKKKGGGQPGAKPKDPITGLALRQDGTFIASSGSGPITRIKVIPPADMAELAKNGIAPYEIPNWDKDDPESNWYLQYRKFTPDRRALFLSKLEQHGRIALAARWAGVAPSTINRHRKEDPEFDLACEESLAFYHEMCVASITHQARVGQIDEKYDKEGNLISRRVQYEQQLRMMMVKRADPSYNDVQKQEVSVVGGAVVVPAPIDSVESWEDVVRRHTGSPAVGPATAGTLSERGLPREGGMSAAGGSNLAGGSNTTFGGSTPKLDAGSADGDVVETDGSEIGETE